MKGDITAILAHYTKPAMAYKAIQTLKQLGPRLKSIIVLREWQMSPRSEPDHVKYINAIKKDSGRLLNDIISQLNTSYVLFLQNTDYLSPTVNPDSLNLPDGKSALVTYYHNVDIVIHQPVLIRTSLFKKRRLPYQNQLPFREALFPAWLSSIKSTQKLEKADLTRQSRESHSYHTLKKENMISKYQLKKKDISSPTVSVIMSIYNMERYVAVAIMSCLFQNVTFDQILIMDDGSTDNSHQLVQRMAKENGVEVFHKKNGGKARALNDLLPYVTSQFILELDADDWLDPDACAVIKQHLSELSEDVSVLYGNLMKWKQTGRGIIFKEEAKGTVVGGRAELLAYRFPLGPRVYRTSILNKEGGFPVITFENGRLYEDVSVLYRLLKKHPICYRDFSVYNVREHGASITRNNMMRWNDYLRNLIE